MPLSSARQAFALAGPFYVSGTQAAATRVVWRP